MLQADVVAWKKKQTPNVAARPVEGKAGTPLPTVTPVINPK